jgi:predicted Zn-dependent protease
MDYYEPMKHLYRLAVLLALTLNAAAQVPAASTPAATPTVSALDGELFYQLLLGELNVRSGEPGAGYSLILDAARKTNDAALYQRAVEIALQSRSGDAALQAATAWKTAQPSSREANRYVLQILIAINRIGETAGPLKTEISSAPVQERPATIASLPRLYARTQDRKLAASVVEQALAEALKDPATRISAWTTVGRMRLLAGDTAGALEAARQGQAADAGAEGPALLALEIMAPSQPLAEPIVNKYLEGAARPEIRMAYARALIDSSRQAEALHQLRQIIRDKPDFPEAWLVLGSLQNQDNQLADAETSLNRFLALTEESRPT